MNTETDIDQLCSRFHKIFFDETRCLAELAHRRVSLLFRMWIPTVDFFQDLIPYDEVYASCITLEALRLLEEDKKKYSHKNSPWNGIKLRNRITLAFAEAYALHAEGKGHKWNVCPCDPCFMSHELLCRVFRDPFDRFKAQLSRSLRDKARLDAEVNEDRGTPDNFTLSGHAKPETVHLGFANTELEDLNYNEYLRGQDYVVEWEAYQASRM